MSFGSGGRRIRRYRVRAAACLAAVFGVLSLGCGNDGQRVTDDGVLVKGFHQPSDAELRAKLDALPFRVEYQEIAHSGGGLVLGEAFGDRGTSVRFLIRTVDAKVEGQPRELLNIDRKTEEFVEGRTGDVYIAEAYPRGRSSNEYFKISNAIDDLLCVYVPGPCV